jgi:peroxiredoxin
MNKGQARYMYKYSKQILAAFLCLLFLTVAGASSVSIGDRAPDFALRSLAGKNLRLSEYRSEVVVLNFWASWCSKCRDAMPVLNSIYQQYQPEGLQVFSVGIDGGSPKAIEFTTDMGIAFPIMPDNEKKTVSRMYALGSMPLTLVIDREGNVRHIQKGFKRDSGAKLEAVVAKLLAE